MDGHVLGRGNHLVVSMFYEVKVLLFIKEGRRQPGLVVLLYQPEDLIIALQSALNTPELNHSFDVEGLKGRARGFEGYVRLYSGSHGLGVNLTYDEVCLLISELATLPFRRPPLDIHDEVQPLAESLYQKLVALVASDEEGSQQVAEAVSYVRVLWKLLRETPEQRFLETVTTELPWESREPVAVS